jgi:hypothetical protein
MLEDILYFESELFGSQRSEHLKRKGFPHIWVKRLIKQSPSHSVLKILNGEGSFEKVNLKKHPIALVPPKHLDLVPQLVRFGITVVGTGFFDNDKKDVRQLFRTLGAAKTLDRTSFDPFVDQELLGLYLQVMVKHTRLLVIESDLEQGEFLNKTLNTNHFQTLWLQYIEAIDHQNKIIYGYDANEAAHSVRLTDFPLAIVGHHSGYSSGADFIQFLREYGLYSVGIFNNTVEWMDVQRAGSMHAIKPADFPIFVSEDLSDFAASEIRKEFELQPIFHE